MLSVIPGNPLLWTFLMQNLNLGIGEIESGTSENLCTPDYSGRRLLWPIFACPEVAILSGDHCPEEHHFIESRLNKVLI